MCDNFGLGSDDFQVVDFQYIVTIWNYSGAMSDKEDRVVCGSFGKPLHEQSFGLFVE